MPILELRSVHKSFGKLLVLNDLSFSLEKGEALGVLGPNGAGKTTMLNVICGESPVGAGTVWFDSHDVTRTPPAQRCHIGIGRTYQIPRPFSGMTALENVLVGATFGRGRRERESYVLCKEVLQQTGLYHKRDELAGKLRLLDRKRLELARALATEPKLLLLDEIAGGLTDHEVQALLDVIAEIRARGVSIIWIEHIVHALVKSVDRILAMNFGSKLIEGKPREVIASEALKEIYLGVE
jgi:branched-chain amino acid transport system ATP-binding protein